MEPDASPGPAPRNVPRRVLVLVVVVVVIAAAILAGWFVLRPLTIAGVYGLDHLQAGSQITVAGTITGIHRENTSYGPRVALGLDDEATCRDVGNVFGDPNETYRVGEPFQTTLHFQSLTVNGDPGVWAPELACPFPAKPEAIGEVIDSVSLIAGILLAFNGTDSGGWSHFSVVTTSGDAYRGDALPVALRRSPPIPGTNPALPAGGPVDSATRWATWASVQYVETAGGFLNAPVVDRMASLTSGTSQNGTMRFVDANGNGLVDDADRFEVHLAPASAGTWDTYWLTVGGFDSPDRRYVNGFQYLLNGASGFLDIPRAQRQPAYVQLRYLGTAAGPPVTSWIDVHRVPYGDAPRIDDVQYSLGIDSRSDAGNVSSLPGTLAGGGSLAFTDANADGRLDAGDSFLAGGMANRTSLRLSLQVASRSIGFLSWFAGYGAPIGDLPVGTLQSAGGDPWTVTATVPFWNPALVIPGTARVDLEENLTAVVTDVPLVNGTVATFPGGSLLFTDADGDGYLSTGDRFVLQGNPTSRYTLRLSVLFSTWAMAWTP